MRVAVRKGVRDGLPDFSRFGLPGSQTDGGDGGASVELVRGHCGFGECCERARGRGDGEC